MTKSRDTADILEDVKVDGNVTAVGQETLKDNTGAHNTGVGYRAMYNSSLSGSFNVALGNYNLYSNTSGASNTALGYQSLFSNTTASESTAVGYQSLYNSNAADNTAIGTQSQKSTTSGSNNTSVGAGSSYGNTTGSYNTSVGRSALQNNTTASNNTAVGYRAAYTQSNANAAGVTAIGYQAGYNNDTGPQLFVGREAGYSTTTGESNTAVGAYRPLYSNTTGAYNTAIGRQALQANTTANYNTAVGHQAGYVNTTGAENVAIGSFSLDSNTTGSGNVAIGYGSGNTITTGSKNSILGSFDGNQGGLDIRTSSNNIVLSDGDGNVRQYINGDGDVIFPSRDSATSISAIGLNTLTIQATDSGCPVIYSNDDNNVRYRVSFRKNGTTIGSIVTTGSNTAYNTASDHRLKENVDYTWDATTRLKQLKPARFNFIADGTDTVLDGFIAHEAQTVVPESVSGTHNEVDEDGNPEYQGIDHSKLVPLLVKTIQELEARITALEA